MQADRPADDQFAVPAPNYSWGFLHVSALVAGVVLAALTLLLKETKLTWLWVGVIATCALIGPLFVVHAWFAGSWLRCVVRRASKYPSLLREKNQLWNDLLRALGRSALGARAPDVPVTGVYLHGAVVRILVGGGEQSALAEGEVLLVVHGVPPKLVGRARMVQLRPTAEAEVYEPLDAVFWGFVRQQIAAFRRKLPEDAVVLREVDVQAREDAVKRSQTHIEALLDRSLRREAGP